MPRTTLVTGAAGFAGAHLLQRLQQQHEGRVIIGWTRSALSPQQTTSQITWRSLDMLDANAVSRAIAAEPPDEIYHLAGAAHTAASWDRPSEYLDIHVRGTHHLLDAVYRQPSPCRVLVVSSGMIYKPQDHAVNEDAPLGPVSPYALSKLAEDQLARHAAAHDGLDVVVARPFNHIGPGQDSSFSSSSFARQIAEIERGNCSPVMSVGNLDAARDVTDVRDVAAAYEVLMRSGRKGAAYNVCCGQAMRMSELLDQLVALSSARIERAADPARMRPNDFPFMAGDSTRLRQETGWAPMIPLAQTLNDLLNYWRETLARSH